MPLPYRIPNTIPYALDHLVLFTQAPRLTPTSSLPGGGGTTSHDVCYRAAVEVQDSYVVLQNATHKGRELLGRLRGLQGQAVEGVQQQEQLQLLHTAGEGKGEWEGGGLQELGQGGDVDVDVVLFRQVKEEQEGGGGGGEGEAAGLGAEGGLPPVTPERQLAALSLSPQPAVTPAWRVAGAAAEGASPMGTPAVAAGGHGTAGAGAGAAGGAGSRSSSDLHGKGRGLLLSDPELAVAMGELCREAAAEVEMLVGGVWATGCWYRVANGPGSRHARSEVRAGS